MRIKALFCTAIALTALHLAAADVGIFEKGKALLPIALPQNATPAEKYAAEELAAYLGRMSGASFKVQEASATPSIRLVYDEKLGREEWEYSALKDGIVIRGGRPRGVLYGAYEFLEREAGVRWLSQDSEYVPSKKSLAVKIGLKRSGKPAFGYRWIYDMAHAGSPRHYAFRTRARMNVYDEPPGGSGAKYGYIERTGAPGGCHTCYDYSRDFPDEYFSLSKEGKRQRAVGGAGPGGVCWSNPEVQRLFAQKLRKYIENDRKDAAATGRSVPNYYDISCNDTSDTCHCDNCRKIAEKHGESGLFLTFLNAIARDIAKDYPEITIISLAYGCALRPPKDIVAEKNVLLRIGQLGKELSIFDSRDSLRSLFHPHNRQCLEDIREWSKYAPHLGTWDYWVLYTEPFRSPHTALPMLKENLGEYKRLGFDFIFAESENYSSYPNMRLQSFWELRDYVAYHLMLDTEQDTAPLIGEFMAHFYGPAAKPMKSYYEYLARRQDEEKGWLGITHPARRKFLDAEFFTRVTAWLDQAEKAVEGDKVLRQRVRQERMIVDEAILNMRDALVKAGFKAASIDELVASLEKDYTEAYEKYYIYPEERKKGLEDKIAAIRTIKVRPKLPQELQGRRVFDYYWSVPTPEGGSFQVIQDQEACTGFAMAPRNPKGGAGFHARPPSFGFYDRLATKDQLSVNIPYSKLAQDEKYHWYRIGRIKPSAGTIMWLHWSWHCTAPVQNVFSATEPDKVFDVFISLKVQGPSYVKGSAKQDEMLVDRVVLAEYFDDETTPATSFGSY